MIDFFDHCFNLVTSNHNAYLMMLSKSQCSFPQISSLIIVQPHVGIDVLQDVIDNQPEFISLLIVNRQG